ncbi:hypothetical protein [Glutamicibacter sp. TV12E]|uniref:hypothetical protein n=1 Tax=Glutamicibacter sp. TV12E TaxID=3446362 RepID=UPI0040341988
MKRAAEQLYVGFSPARSLLVVVGGRQLADEASGANLQISLKDATVWTVPDALAG